MYGSKRLIDFAVAEEQARRQRMEADRRTADHGDDRPEGFDASSTPLPSYKPLAGGRGDAARDDAE
jgi:hypothetical protein